MSNKLNDIERISKISYQFTAVPTNLFLLLDNNCRSMLFTLIQLSFCYAEEDGYFFRSNTDLQEESNLSKNLVIVTTDTLYNAGVIHVKSVGKSKGKYVNYYKVNFEKIKEYEILSLEETKNPENKIETLKYKGSNYTASYTVTDTVKSEHNKEVVTDTVTDTVKSEHNIDNIYNIENIENKNNINKKDNISNNILEKKLSEKLSEKMKDKNSDKECSVETPHSNVGNVIECTPSKSFPFSSLEDEANSIDRNNSDTSTEIPLSSTGLIDNTKDEQSINSTERVLENGLKEELLPMKENEDKTVKECSVSTEHSNSDKFYNDFAFFVEELNKKEKEANSIDANNNTPTEKPLSSSGLKNNSSSKEDVSERIKTQQSEAKECVVKSAEVLIEKLTKILSREELISKATLYVEWLERQKDALNCEELFKSLMDKGSEVFATTYDCVDGEESKKEVVVDVVLESFDEDEIDEVVSDFFGSSSVEHTHVETEQETKEDKEQDKKIRVKSTGELITVEEAMKRGSALGNDIEDITSSRCNSRRRKTDYSYHFQG